jgi:hypothetical protein
MPADESQVAHPRTSVITWGWVFTVLSALLVPWTIYLFVALPKTARAAHYDLAWGGFDVGLVLLLGLTGVGAVRHGPWLPAAAGATAAALLTDAWFDVVMAAGTEERWIALAMAFAVELPLSIVCAWLAVRGQELLHRRIRWGPEVRSHHPAEGP